MTKIVRIIAFVVDTEEASRPPWGFLPDPDASDLSSRLALHLSEVLEGGGISDIVLWDTPDEFVSDHANHNIDVGYLEETETDA